MKILLAETTERTEIFRRVFATDIYNRITVNLNNRQREAKERLQELKIEFATVSSTSNMDEKVDSKDINELYISQILENLKLEDNKNKEEVAVSNKELKAIEKELKNFEDNYKEKINIKIEVDNIQKDLKKLDKILGEIQEEDKKSSNHTKNLKIIKSNLKEYNNLNEKNIFLKNKIQRVKDITNLNKDYEKNVKEYNQQELDYKNSSNDYIEKEDEFFREQAGILALKLEEGKPCPVCGSLEHPNPASKSNSVLSKEELEELKNKLELKRKELTKVKEKITGLKSKINTLIEELEINQEIDKEQIELEANLKENEKSLKEIYDKINEAYLEITKKKFKLDNFDFEKFQEEVNSRILEIKNEITKNSALKGEKEKELNKKKEIIEEIDFEKIEEELRNNKKELEQKRANFVNINMNFENNKKALTTLEKLAEKLINQIKEFNVIDELYKTASGTLPKKTKINFEQYIQTNYFDMVVQEANKRFLQMTDGRFRLLRKENSAKISDKIALELEVLDYYNGKKRDVKSLSGGESFKAALCLALGLSDIIQSYSGGVQVDTLFIDEGFGSLDSESREQAINTLSQLAGSNKLIGIISHVTELQERIDKKIIVNKGIEGSTIEFDT